MELLGWVPGQQTLQGFAGLMLSVGRRLQFSTSCVLCTWPQLPKTLILRLPSSNHCSVIDNSAESQDRNATHFVPGVGAQKLGCVTYYVCLTVACALDTSMCPRLQRQRRPLPHLPLL
eukprot:2252502-Amphidinium_carterae.3